MASDHPLLAKLGVTSKVETELPQFDPSVIPTMEDVGGGHDTELDRLIDPIGIVEAYRRWSNKSPVPDTTRTESVKVSCPNPDHPDKNPSAWLNTEKNVYHCGACERGGDKYTIAAYRFGFDPDTYQSKENFPKLVAAMAEDLGYVVKKTATGQEYIEEIKEEPEPVSETADAKAGDGTDTPTPAKPMPVVLPAPDPAVVLDHLTGDFHLDWESLFPANTFLAQWMEEVTIDDLPHEYYAALGLMAVAAAVGRRVYMNDFKPVYSNLYACLYGNTSTGKSRAIHPFMELIRQVMPYTGDDNLTDPTGVLMAPSPVSAEAMLDLFQHEVLDPSSMAHDHYSPVNGVVTIEELSEFVARAQRLGSSLKEVSMALFDGSEEVKTKSLTGGLRVAHQPFCQMITTTQPNATREFLTKRDEYSGFLNRWVVFFGRSRVRPLSYGRFSPDLSGPAVLLRRIYDWSIPSHTYTLEGHAFDRWDQFFNDTIVPMKLEGVPILGRIDLILKKFIVIFAANECAPNPQERHVDMAVSMYDYLISTMRLFSSDVKSSEYEEVWALILQIVMGHETRTGLGPTRRQINNSVKDKYPASMVTQVIIDMAKAEILVEEVTKPKRGPSTTRYKLNGD